MELWAALTQEEEEEEEEEVVLNVVEEAYRVENLV